jgi:hypothetical protein
MLGTRFSSVTASYSGNPDGDHEVSQPKRKVVSVMKKIALLLGGIAGFLLGSYAGRGPYERVEAWARQLRRRPEVERVADQVTESAGQLSDVATGAAS